MFAGTANRIGAGDLRRRGGGRVSQDDSVQVQQSDLNNISVKADADAPGFAKETSRSSERDCKADEVLSLEKNSPEPEPFPGDPGVVCGMSGVGGGNELGLLDSEGAQERLLLFTFQAFLMTQ